MRKLALLSLLTLLFACEDSTPVQPPADSDLLIASGSGRNPHNPLVGVWWGTDPVDGSLHRLTIGHETSAGDMQVHLFDDGCGICGDYPCGFKSWGRIVAENVLKPADITTQCRNSERDALMYPPLFGWEYMPATDEMHYCYIPETTPIVCTTILTRRRPGS
jgi:hypothetical protein